MPRTWLKWTPAVVAVVVVAGVSITLPFAANASATLPTKTPAQVLELVATSHVAAFSGTITETSDLGLPSLPSSGAPGGAPVGGSSSSVASILSLVTGTNDLRVYVDGPSKTRLQDLGSLSEKDVIHNGKDLWIYDSGANSVEHTTLKAGKHQSDVRPATSPDVLAKKLLAALEPTSTVTVAQAVNVAGRSAYELVLTPKATDTLLGSVTIAVDSTTGLPLGVDVRAAGQETPAVSVAFSSLDLSRPAASLFDFTVPKGATVNKPEATPEQKPTTKPKSGAAKPTESVTGKGWDAVLTLAKVGSLSQLTGSSEFGELTTATPDGRVLHTTLFNILFTTDGRVIAGSVSIDRLEAVAAAS